MRQKLEKSGLETAICIKRKVFLFLELLAGGNKKNSRLSKPTRFIKESSFNNFLKC